MVEVVLLTSPGAGGESSHGPNLPLRAIHPPDHSDWFTSKHVIQNRPFIDL